jgi:hypothetical protein
MKQLLGNIISSELTEELEFGTYIARRTAPLGKNLCHDAKLDSYYLVSIRGKAPFLQLNAVVALPNLNVSVISDTRDLVIIKRLCRAGCIPEYVASV